MDMLKDICKTPGRLGILVFLLLVWGCAAYADVYETDAPAAIADDIYE